MCAAVLLPAGPGCGRSCDDGRFAGTDDTDQDPALASAPPPALAASLDSRRGLTVAARLVWIQTAQSSDLALKAQAIQTDLVDLPAARGDIVDRNGNLLAGNRTTFQVSADETVSQAALQRLSQMSSVPVADLQARLLVCGQPGAQPGTCYRGQPGSHSGPVGRIHPDRSVDRRRRSAGHLGQPGRGTRLSLEGQCGTSARLSA